MAQKKLKNTYNKRKKNLIKNLILKQGKKEKTEKILKHGFKKFQKQEKRKTLPETLKIAVIKMSKSVEFSTQVVKKGKKKVAIKTLNVLVSEKSRFSNGYRRILEETGQEVLSAAKLRDKLADAILKGASHQNPEIDSNINFSDKKTRIKFKY